ncbi:hypothetical protein [Haloplanus halophilus]|uniref:hypothetical protein n=1 Tax=Haloplanus halophilus TaxID=2949993 RepID=UPI00203E574E|nr:hypothetical protein [Haloplanus sp. GDY1]
MDCPAFGSSVTIGVGPERPLSTSLRDAGAIERAALVDEITDELSTIDNVETLEETLAAIRQQRGTDPAMTDTDDDATE